MMLVRLLMVLVLLGTSPAARAVDCVMGMADPMAMDAEHAGCPMMQAAMDLQAKAPAMTVADCFHDVGLIAPDLTADVEHEAASLALQPVTDVVHVAVPMAHVAYHPPPLPRARQVLLTSGRWRL